MPNNQNPAQQPAEDQPQPEEITVNTAEEIAAEEEAAETAATVQEIATPQNNEANAGWSLSSAFRTAAAVILGGAVLTTGIGMAFNFSAFDQSLTAQTIDTASLFVSSMAVWTMAMGTGVVGHMAGKGLTPDNAPNSVQKWAPRAFALGTLLIAARFVMPLGTEIYDNVHDGLTERFDSPETAQKSEMNESAQQSFIPKLG